MLKTTRSSPHSHLLSPFRPLPNRRRCSRRPSSASRCKIDVPGTNYETVIGMAEIVPDLKIGKHSHPAPAGYMLEGEMVLMIDGQPDKTVKAGRKLSGAVRRSHDAKSGPKGAKVIATYVVEKGRPLASPVQVT